MREIPFTVFCDGAAMCGPEPVRRYLWEACAAAGMPYVVLTCDMIRMIAGDPGMAGQFRRDAEASGVRFVDSHAPFASEEYLIRPAEGRESMLTRNRLAIEIAADMGVDTITIHIGNPRPEYAGYTADQLCDAAKRSLEELLPCAERCGVVICIENIWFPTTHPGRVLEIFDAVRSDFLGICYDAGHANLMDRGRLYDDCAAKKAWEGWGEIPWEEHCLERFLPHIVNTHLHDNDGSFDQHLLPGDGNISWEKIVPLLKRAPRLRSIQSETEPMGPGKHAPVARIASVYRDLLGLRDGMVPMEA